MSKRTASVESIDNNPSKKLGQRRENYLKKQIYYFYPFLRGFYQILKQMDSIEDELKSKSLQKVKRLLSYYANAFVFGEFNIDQEQGHIDNLFAIIDERIPRKELRDEVSIGDWGGAQSDGSTEEYLFGSLPCREFSALRVPGAPYSLGMSGGIMESVLIRDKLLFPLAGYIARNRKQDQVSIWGNITRGSIEAAAIHTVLERAGVPSSLHLYRASSHASFDTVAVSVAEPEHHASWAIAVDTLSAGGPSVPMTREFLTSLHSNRASVYLTYGGEFWSTKMPVEFRSPLWRASKLGILLKAA